MRAALRDQGMILNNRGGRFWQVYPFSTLNTGNMRWKCVECGTENGPEAAYCPECGAPEPKEDESRALIATRTRSAGESRSTLVGSSAGVAPSLLDRGPDPALIQPLPRQVRISGAGWVALVGGWPELSLCMVIVPMVAFGVFAATRGLIGLGGAALVAGGLALSVVMALLFGAAETSRTIRGYRLLRRGWAAGGEVARKIQQRGRLGVTYLVEYAYIDAQGVRRRSRQEVTEEQWRSLVEHQPVTVLYSPVRPETSVVYEFLGVIAVAPRSLPAALDKKGAEVGQNHGNASPAALPHPTSEFTAGGDGGRRPSAFTED